MPFYQQAIEYLEVLKEIHESQDRETAIIVD